MDDRVKVTISEGVADVRLVRADKMNALDAAMFEALVATCDRLSREKGLRWWCYLARGGLFAPASTWAALRR
jgi:enoyl-CoA hydratase/carnithine racemase